MRRRDIDKLVASAFDNLVKKALTSETLSNVALNGGEHEKEVEKLFHSVLSPQFGMDTVCRQKIAYYRKRRKFHDVVVMHGTRKAVVVEIKSIFTDPGGVSGKLSKGKGMEKDMRSLRLALDNEKVRTYELAVLFECFPVNKGGEPINDPDSRITWQREWGYVPRKGEQKGNRELKRLAREQGLKAKRIKGWDRVELPSPHSNIRAFLDCALYKVQLR